MRYFEMGLAFAAVGFVVANAALSFLTVCFWRAAEVSSLRARTLFLLRMLPAIGSASLVVGLVLPAYWSFEPRATSERAGPVLVAFVILAAVLVATGLLRTLSSWLVTRRLERGWRAAAVGSASFGIRVRAYRVPSEMPLAALVGVVRPRLFVSERFLEALSEGDRRAVIEHEEGHLRSLDNLKRTAMRLAPDWLSFSLAAREIETAWAAAAEAEADDHAAGPDRSRSLDLASALLKAARLTPMRLADVSNFCDEPTIARRVARLLADDSAGRKPAGALAPLFAGILVLLAAAGPLLGPTLRVAYAMTEAAIRWVQ